MASKFVERFKKPITGVGVGVRSSATEADDSVTMILSGNGAPSGAQPQGTLYLRKNGSTPNEVLYVETDGAGTWEAVEASLTGTGGAALIGIADAGTYYTGTDVEAALQEIGANVGFAGITDTGTYYTTDTVDGALDALARIHSATASRRRALAV